ncbi:polysaccharide deacetylase family protein [Undibacterium sp. RTI2.1]|uniref:polysaccharide deacetylase family protein n=1 Tax=unclassified Undibacterium TaxID=2630295 RepID=UPI002AB4E462|nr:MULTISPECIES: polysaccharide deacetylase family protein [unclassified Undibacterium]MDY7538275.1 polysaccharide deacetylase family protein [Undibacterium sp. 5I1]MEB0030922.1 polysaccharide deacetylase family protein [Undibacterium sp. RTI2.1]MEB0117400.1 polysaccharide deacetylase family protein [Undibacterium sp. RTI2.2]MEB0256062.1 polysaccharide deacetylase family protein [Undibacterium sp. 5I1]
MSQSRKIILAIAAFVVAALVASGAYIFSTSKATKPEQGKADLVDIAPSQNKLPKELGDILAAYRKVIVLLGDEKSLNAKEKTAANRIGQALFHENLGRLVAVDDYLDSLKKLKAPEREAAYDTILNFIESGEGLFDADRLAFREVLLKLQKAIATEQTLPAIKLHKRVGDDLAALDEIEREYDKELKDIFSRFETRSIELKRERWDDYLNKLRKLYPREQILKDYGVILPYPEIPEPVDPAAAKDKDIFGTGLPAKTIVLTFDDGPHATYTDEIAAILKQYNVPAVFFQVGRNVGTVDAQGKEKLNKNADISKKLLASGYAIGNHSFSHALLSKENGDSLHAEIAQTDQLLKAIDPARSSLFRFPYGAKNKEGMQILSSLGLRSVLWNIDSLDWADPVPNSIANRVLATVDKEQRGIILFHDIHERTVKALPLVLDKLIADGYHFAGWNGSEFKVGKETTAPVEKISITTDYQNSWAVVIGINDYAKWPKLQYAVQDANSIRDMLIGRLGFSSDKVITLTNADATRNNILSVFHDKLGHGQLKKDDRVFVFFAGHGATRKLSSGRNLGYIIPVDSDPEQISVDAIPMTDLQNIAESLNAKHILFVMDACYSGLGLTRGGGTSSFLRENAKRLGRQMLTAGGADQLVADGGPNGHSVFTWTLLQALSGKADLNGDGMITATELAAYIAPAVSSVSQQTPAFGSLPGSEGGEFVFEVRSESEFLNAKTDQLSADAIALNSKIDGARNKVGTDAPIVIKNLNGGEQKIAAPKPVDASSRQLAQRANDQGLQLYREKQYAQAEAAFTEALKYRPDFGLAANNLGFVYFKQEKFAEAARWFENTLQIDPSRAIAYLNLGDARARLNDNEKAKAAYNTFLQLSPNSPNAAYVREALKKLN